MGFDFYLMGSSKLFVFDEIVEIYHYFMLLCHTKSPLQSSKASIDKMLRALVGSNRKHICVNLIKIWNHNLKKCAGVGLEKKMDFIVAVYGVMNVFDQRIFCEQFMDSLKKRSKSKLYRLSNIFQYYDKMIIDKLNR